MTRADFQFDGKTPSFNDLLNNLHTGFEIVCFVLIKILWLMRSSPTALLAFKTDIMSMISDSKIEIIS